MPFSLAPRHVLGPQTGSWLELIIGEESVVFTEGRMCPFLPSPRAAPVSLPGAGLVPRAGPPSSPSYLLPDEPWVPRSHAGLPPLEQAGGPTKPNLFREKSVPVQGTLLTY